MTFNVGDVVKCKATTISDGFPADVVNAILNQEGVIVKKTNDGFALWYGPQPDGFDPLETPAACFFSEFMIHINFSEMLSFDVIKPHKPEIDYTRFVNIGSF